VRFFSQAQSSVHRRSQMRRSSDQAPIQRAGEQPAAAEEGVVSSYVSRLIRLSFLAPDMVTAIFQRQASCTAHRESADGRHPPDQTGRLLERAPRAVPAVDCPSKPGPGVRLFCARVEERYKTRQLQALYRTILELDQSTLVTLPDV
jgi:hypothetical protein